MSELKLPKANLVYCRHELESIPVDRGYAVIGVSKWNFFCDAFRKTRKQLDVSDNLLQALINALPLLHTGDEIPISYYADKPGVLGEALRAIAKAKGE